MRDFYTYKLLVIVVHPWGADEGLLYLQTTCDCRPFLEQIFDVYTYKLLVIVVHTWGRCLTSLPTNC